MCTQPLRTLQNTLRPECIFRTRWLKSKSLGSEQKILCHLTECLLLVTLFYSYNQSVTTAKQSIKFGFTITSILNTFHAWFDGSRLLKRYAQTFSSHRWRTFLNLKDKKILQLIHYHFTSISNFKVGLVYIKKTFLTFLSTNIVAKVCFHRFVS